VPRRNLLPTLTHYQLVKLILGAIDRSYDSKDEGPARPPGGAQFGVPPAQYGAPPQQQGSFGQPPPQSGHYGYGQPPPQGGYGGGYPPPPPNQGGRW
jgi:hypothetical protein